MTRFVEDANGEWARAIGNGFVAFGAIEWLILICLIEIPNDRIYESTKKLGLAQKIDILLEILKVHEGDIYDDISLKLKEIKELSKFRNILAHNPLTSIIDDNSDTGFSDVILSLHKDQKLNLKEVKDFSERSESLANELRKALEFVSRDLRKIKYGQSA